MLAVVALVLTALGGSVSITVAEQKQIHEAVVERLKKKKVLNTSSEIDLQEHENWLKLYLTCTSQAISKLVVGIVMVGYGLLETLNGTSAVPLGVVLVGAGMGVLHAFVAILIWAGNHLSKSDAISSLYYGVPVLALALLWGLTDVQVGNATMFLIGMTGIVAANIAIHLNPEGTDRRHGHTDAPVSGHGFKALMVALWVSGAVVVLRDELLPELMLAWAMPEYWAILAVGATVFVLILSFRLARLSELRRESDRMLLTVHKEIETCCDRALLSQDERVQLIKLLREVDTKRKIKEIRDSYLGMHKILLADAHARTDDLNERDKLRNLLCDIEIFANLRQRGRNIVELMVMALFAALTMSVALFVRPLINGGAPEPYIAFTVELFAIAFSAAIGFMAFDLLDKRAERDSGLLWPVSPYAEHGQPSGWRLNFDSYKEPKADRIFAGILSIAVFAMFAALLVSKWF